MPPPDPAGVFSFSIENDTFARTDRWYTNGVQIAWRSQSARLPRPLAWLNAQIGFLTGEGGQLRWGFALGHNIYTASNRLEEDPPPGDRPYAAYLYGALSLTRYSERTFNLFEIQLGMVGPAALGEQVQNGFHRVINDERVRGWNTQLHNEPVFDVLTERKWRFGLYSGPHAGLEVIPSVVLSLGTVQTYAGAGVTVRFGEALDADFGAPRIRPALAGSQFFEPRDRFGWYVFAGVDGRAVARDIFLDGNTFRESRSADRRPFVGDVSTGFAVFSGAARLTFTYTIRSREFDEQRRAAAFASVSLSVRF